MTLEFLRNVNKLNGKIAFSLKVVIKIEKS